MSDGSGKRSVGRKLGGAILRGSWALTKGTARNGGKLVLWSSGKLWRNRDSIGGSVAGVAEASKGAIVYSASHVGFQRRVNRKTAKLEVLAERQRQLTERFRRGAMVANAPRNTVLDTVAIGGETLATYLHRGRIPEEIQRAYEYTYPSLASEISFLERVQELEGMALIGFISALKGKLFELQYVEYLNEGALPDGYRAFLPNNPLNPGWDIGILGPDGRMKDLIQLKATESVGHVQQALERYPHIDVVTTSEVHAQLLAQGMADRVIDSGIQLADVHTDVFQAISVGEIAMDWTPPLVAIALVAFTSYSRKSMSEFDRSREFGNRSAQAYLAYLAGGAVAGVTGTVLLGLLGAVGTRLVFASGRKKSKRLDELSELIKHNVRAQRRLANQLRAQSDPY